MKKDFDIDFNLADFTHIDVSEISATKYFEERALEHAEQIGVYEYEVKDSKMIYLSYYGRTEKFIKVTYDLLTGGEIRKSQKTTTKKYNYYCG